MRSWHGLFWSLKKPAFVENIFIHSENDRILYLNPDAPDWVTIEKKYKPILDLINGNNSKKTILDFIRDNYTDEKDLLLSQMKSIFKSSKIFKKNNDKYFKLHRNKYNLPKNIYLTVTDNCNLKCVYCYATEREINENTTLEKWKEYVSSIIDFSGKPNFIITGGEPLTVSYLLDLASFIKSKGCELILLTNGTLITSDDIAEKISEYFSLVKISLDSIEENTSKELRGAGTLEKVKNAYNLLLKKGCNVLILATVNSKNCNSLDGFSNYFNNQVNFQPLYSMGKAKNENELYITGEQYYNSLTKYGRFTHLHDFSDNINYFMNNPCKRCAMADIELSIASNGNVYPCHMLHYDDYICGNLNEQNIKDIYYNSPVINELRNINVDNIPQCKKCNFRNICGGACRARVNVVENDLLGNDDFCEFEQKQILDALVYSNG